MYPQVFINHPEYWPSDMTYPDPLGCYVQHNLATPTPVPAPVAAPVPAPVAAPVPAPVAAPVVISASQMANECNARENRIRDIYNGRAEDGRCVNGFCSDGIIVNAAKYIKGLNGGAILSAGHRLGGGCHRGDCKGSPRHELYEDNMWVIGQMYPQVFINYPEYWPSDMTTDPLGCYVPPVVKSSPPVVKSSPPVVKSAPPVVKSAPPVVKSSPPVVKSAPPAEVIRTVIREVTLPPVAVSKPPKSSSPLPILWIAIGLGALVLIFVISKKVIKGNSSKKEERDRIWEIERAEAEKERIEAEKERIEAERIAGLTDEEREMEELTEELKTETKKTKHDQDKADIQDKIAAALEKREPNIEREGKAKQRKKISRKGAEDLKAGYEKMGEMPEDTAAEEERTAKVEEIAKGSRDLLNAKRSSKNAEKMEKIQRESVAAMLQKLQSENWEEEDRKKELDRLQEEGKKLEEMQKKRFELQQIALNYQRQTTVNQPSGNGGDAKWRKIKDEFDDCGAFGTKEIEDVQRRFKSGQDAIKYTCLCRGDEHLYNGPEDLVVQLFLNRLINTYGYPVEDLEVEKQVQMGRDTKKRADIVVYTQGRPYIVIEAKAPRARGSTRGQLESYMNALGATFGVWTDGRENSYYRRTGNQLEAISEIPKYR